ncbi:Hypothetical predicted protein, partial [Paramuricea clavata]
LEEKATGIDPSLVIEACRRAMSLIGNASHCALVDRRKGLLAKVSPDCLDLVDDPELFGPGSSELFGKKFKKAILKDLKLSKEMDSLMSGGHHGNGKNNYKPFKPFRQQPGKGPGYNPRSWDQSTGFNSRSWNQPSQCRGGFSRRGKSNFPSRGKQH